MAASSSSPVSVGWGADDDDDDDDDDTFGLLAVPFCEDGEELP